MELEKIREDIDSIDRELLKLLNQRFELGIRAKRHKKEIFAPSREAEILKKLSDLSRSYNLVRPNFLEKLFKIIFQESRRIQKENKTLIGFKRKRKNSNVSDSTGKEVIG
jgi:chorismate mutase